MALRLCSFANLLQRFSKPSAAGRCSHGGQCRLSVADDSLSQRGCQLRADIIGRGTIANLVNRIREAQEDRSSHAFSKPGKKSHRVMQGFRVQGSGFRQQAYGVESRSQFFAHAALLHPFGHGFRLLWLGGATRGENKAHQAG